jgi:hypothetical protein
MNYSPRAIARLGLVLALFLVAFPERDLAQQRKNLSPRDVCDLTGLKKKCGFSERDKTVWVITSKHMKPSEARRYCDLMVAVLHAWGEIGYRLDPGWKLHVRTSKGELADCSLP